MKLNNIKPADGATHHRRRVGRGIGTGLGKTCGRGHKGQTSRSGGWHRIGFEGGQMPMHFRLPKVGFRSRKARFFEEIRIPQLLNFPEDSIIDIEFLRKFGLINANIRKVKIIGTCDLGKRYIISGLSVTKGAKNSILQAGGKVNP